MKDMDKAKSQKKSIIKICLLKGREVLRISDMRMLEKVKPTVRLQILVQGCQGCLNECYSKKTTEYYSGKISAPAIPATET